MPYKQNKLKYIHQIINAATKDQLEDTLFISKPDLIQKYLLGWSAREQDSVARAKRKGRK